MGTTARGRFERLLRRLEQYTRTDMVYLTKGGFWLAVGQAVQMASGLLLAVAFANLLPKEAYGTYQFIMAAAATLSALTLSGMDTAITRAVAQGSEGALRTGFQAQLRWSSLMAFAAAAAAGYYYLNNNETLAFSFLIAGAFSPFIEGFSLSRSYLVGKKLFRESALLGIGRRLVPVTALISTVLLTQDPLVLIFVYFAANALSAALLYLLILKRYRLPVTDEPAMISYGKHLSVLRAFSDATNQADKILVWVILGAAPLAAYALAHLPIVHVQGAYKLIRSLTLPKLSTLAFPELQRTLPHKARLFFLVTVLVMVFYILAVPLLFALLFPAYPESVALSQALALTLLAGHTLYGHALTAHEKKRELYIMNITYNVLKLALLIILIPLYGLWGAVAALVITHLYANVVIRLLFRHAS